jgi:hypothetical protein
LLSGPDKAQLFRVVSDLNLRLSTNLLVFTLPRFQLELPVAMQNSFTLCTLSEAARLCSGERVSAYNPILNTSFLRSTLGVADDRPRAIAKRSVRLPLIKSVPKVLVEPLAYFCTPSQPRPLFWIVSLKHWNDLFVKESHHFKDIFRIFTVESLIDFWGLSIHCWPSKQMEEAGRDWTTNKVFVNL